MSSWYPYQLDSPYSGGLTSVVRTPRFLLKSLYNSGLRHQTWQYHPWRKHSGCTSALVWKRVAHMGYHQAAPWKSMLNFGQYCWMYDQNKKKKSKWMILTGHVIQCHTSQRTAALMPSWPVDNWVRYMWTWGCCQVFFQFISVAVKPKSFNFWKIRCRLYAAVRPIIMHELTRCTYSHWTRVCGWHESRLVVLFPFGSDEAKSLINPYLWPFVTVKVGSL